MNSPLETSIYQNNIQNSQIRALIIDLDGVLWKGNQPIGNLVAIFAEIKRRNLQVILATNNATLSPQRFLDKLAGFGVNLEKRQLISSGLAAAHYLKKKFPNGGPVYIIGEQGLRQCLEESNFWEADRDVVAVVVGLDRELTYAKIAIAADLIRKGAPFIATNPDSTLPTPSGPVPGAGTMVAAVQVSSGVQPVLIGKPSPILYEIAIQRLNTRPDETLVIGDRLDTDIAGAQPLGCRTGLVLSGIATQQQAAAWQPPVDWIAEDLHALVNLLPK